MRKKDMGRYFLAWNMRSIGSIMVLCMGSCILSNTSSSVNAYLGGGMVGADGEEAGAVRSIVDGEKLAGSAGLRHPNSAGPMGT